MACDRITAGITRNLLANVPSKLCSIRTILSARPIRQLQTSEEIAGRPNAECAISTGSFSTATGKPSSAGWPNRIRRSCLRQESQSRFGSALPLRLGDPDVSSRLHCPRGRRPWRRRPAKPRRRDQRYRGEDAKEKKSTMETYWVPGVNHLGSHGRWAFAEFTDIYQIQSDFAARWRTSSTR